MEAEIELEYQLVKTKNYDIFKFIISNRELDEKHVTDLMEKIEKRNLLHLRPLIVNRDMYLLDGQHRLEAARRLGVYVYYIQDSDISHSDIPVLNSAQNNWTLLDFVNFFALEGYDNFKKFVAFLNEFSEFKPSTLIALVNSRNKNYKLIRSGDLTLTNLHWLRTTCERVRQLAQVGRKDQKDFLQRSFFFFVVHHEVKTEAQFQKLVTQVHKIDQAHSRQAYKEQVVELIHGA